MRPGAVGNLYLLHDVVAHDQQVEKSDCRRPIDRPVGDAHRVEEFLGRAERLLHARRGERKGPSGVVALERFDLAVNDRPDLGRGGAADAVGGGRRGGQGERESEQASPEHRHPPRDAVAAAAAPWPESAARTACLSRARSAITFWAYFADPSRAAPL